MAVYATAGGQHLSGACLALRVWRILHAVDVMRAQRWKNVEPLVKSYFGNTIHLLGTYCLQALPMASPIMLTTNGL